MAWGSPLLLQSQFEAKEAWYSVYMDRFQFLSPSTKEVLLRGVQISSWQLDQCLSWLETRTIACRGSQCLPPGGQGARQFLNLYLFCPSSRIWWWPPALYHPVFKLPFLQKVIEPDSSRHIWIQSDSWILVSLAFAMAVPWRLCLQPWSAVFTWRLTDETALLIFSVAFDAVWHVVLIKRLHDLVGTCKVALNWFCFFLRVEMGKSSLSPWGLSSEVTQGFILWPFPFNVYTNIKS